jgi:hypothetical protein
MAVAGTPLSAIKDFKRGLSSHFNILDMGEIYWFLNFEIKWDRAARKIFINQKAYIEAMAKKFNLQDSKLTYLPAQPGEVLSNIQSPSTPAQQLKMRRKPYAEVIGHVLLPVVVSRPDVAFQTGILSQFVQNPGQAHWNALKRVMSYLNTTKDLWLTLGGEGGKKSIVYTDADWAS